MDAKSRLLLKHQQHLFCTGGYFRIGQGTTATVVPNGCKLPSTFSLLLIPSGPGSVSSLISVSFGLDQLILMFILPTCHPVPLC